MSFCMYCTAGEGNSWQINVTVYVCVCALKEWSHAPCDESYTGWLARERLADWLEAVMQETHQLCTVELKIPTSLPDFLVNWYLICSWLQNSCLYMLHAVLVRNQAPHFEMPCDFNSQFYTSLAHLMQWKMNTDGFGQDRKIPTCMPVIQLFPTRSVFFPASYYMLNDFELLTVKKTQWLKAWFNLI